MEQRCERFDAGVHLTRFWVRSQNCEKRLLASSCLSFRPPVRMEQLGSNWTDFHESSYLIMFRKTAKKMQASLKSDKYSGYFSCRPPDILDHISLSFS
jgi:hypothetical protein